jgi:hypothetical protein
MLCIPRCAATMLVGNDIKESEATRWALRPFREQGLVTTYATQVRVDGTGLAP